MGIQRLFTNANLSGIFESTESIGTKMMHKAKIEIDEEVRYSMVSFRWETNLIVIILLCSQSMIKS